MTSPPPPTYQIARRQLAERLRLFRERAGISGRQLARVLGWVQPRISKLETGKQLPTEEDISAWVKALHLTGEERSELLALLERARAEYASFKATYRAAGGPAGKQAELRALEARSTHLRQFWTGMIPGLLQTAAYASEVVRLPCGPLLWGGAKSEEELARMVDARMQRGQLLYRRDKRIEIIMLEAALRNRLCSREALLSQLDRLLAVHDAPALTLGVIPQDAPLPVFPLSGFSIYDEDLVVIELILGEQIVADPEELALYGRLFELLRGSARYGEGFTDVVRRVIRDLRSQD